MQTSAPRVAMLSIPEIVAMLWRRKLFIVLGTVLGAAAAFVLTLTVSPKYVSRASLLVDLRQLDVTPNSLVPNAPAAILETLVNSERSRLTSHTLLEKVVKENGLEDQTEFKFGAGGSDADRISGAATVLRRKLNVERKKDTLVISVSVATQGAQRSREINQSLLKNYLQERALITQDASAKTLASLRAQLEDQVKRLTEAENEVEQFKIQNAIVSSSGELSDARQITTVTDQLNAARLEVAQIEARYKQVKEAVKSVAAPSPNRASNLSSVISDLRSRQIATQEEYASLQSTLGPSHPSIKSMELRLASLQRALKAELSELVKTVEQDLRTAKGVQQSLEAELKQLENQFGNTNKRLIPLRALELRVEAARSIYTQTLTRIREIRAQDGVDSSNVSVLSKPTLPLENEAVSRKLLLAIGGVFGASMSALFALFTGIIKTPKLDGNSIAQFTGLPLIAELPVLEAQLLRYQNGSLGISLPKLFSRTSPHRVLEGAFDRLYTKLGVSGTNFNSYSNNLDIVLVSSVSAHDSAPFSSNIAARAASEGKRVLLIADTRGARPFVQFLSHIEGVTLANGTPPFGIEYGAATVDFLLLESRRPEDQRQFAQNIERHLSRATDYDLVVIDGQQITNTASFEYSARIASKILLLVGKEGNNPKNADPYLQEKLENAYEVLADAREKVVGFVYLLNAMRGKEMIEQETLSPQDFPVMPIGVPAQQRAPQRRFYHTAPQPYLQQELRPNPSGPRPQRAKRKYA